MDRDIIIIGGNHHNTLGVIRALGECGLKDYIYLILHGDKTAFVSKSRYLKKSNIWYIEDESEISDVIKSISSRLNEKPVIIACGDHYISSIDNDLENLQTICLLPNAKGIQKRINFYLDKENQDHIAKNNGITVPEYEIVDVKDLFKYKRIPCIIKPVNSVKGDKSDIAICRTEQQIEEYHNAHSDSGQVRIESLIDKETEFQLIGCSLSQNIIIPGYTNIIRQPNNTNTGYLVYKPIQDGFISDDFISKVKSFIKEIGYLGLFSVEFIRGRDGIDYFLEINMRNDGNAYCVTTAGVNLPYLWYKYADNPKANIEEPTTFSKPVYWMPEGDIRNARKIGLYKWILEWCQANGHGIFNVRDPFPIIYSIFLRIKNKVNFK